MHSKVSIFAQVLKFVYPQTRPSVMLQWCARELGKDRAYELPLSVMYCFIVALSPQPC